jgi:hypothetical protein
MTAPVYVCPGCKTRIPFGTESNRPPTRCPGCDRELNIPSVVLLPLVEVTCPACARAFWMDPATTSQRRCCTHCGALVDLPPDALQG